MKPIVSACLITLFCLLDVSAGGRVPRKEDIPKYLKMLSSSPNAKDRALAAEMIGMRGQIMVVKEAVDPLLKALKGDPYAEVRKASATALGKMATQPEVVVPALSAALKDKAMPVKLAAVGALAAFGTEARGAIPALRSFAAQQKDKKINKMVRGAIQQISGKMKKG